MPLGHHPVLYAKHYCSQYHPTYNDKEQALVAESGAADWQALFRQQCGGIEIPARWGNPDRATMDPWIISSPYSGGATQITLVRNPYFWQVDTEGNQLPYIERLTADVSQDVESPLGERRPHPLSRPGKEMIDLATLPDRELRQPWRGIRMVFQDPFASLNLRMTVGQIIAEPLVTQRRLKRICDRGAGWRAAGPGGPP